MPENQPEAQPALQQGVAIIGGGWSGLAAAIELCRCGHKVTLFESSPQLGGRARSIQWKNMTLDNGQHLMLGAYQTMLSLFNTLNSAPDINNDISELFEQLPHQLLMLDARNGSTVFDLQLPTFPAPLHLLFGILKTRQLSLPDKYRLLIRFNHLLNTPIKTDLSVSDWLSSANLPESYQKSILEPVCLAALTTHPQQASAKTFRTVLQQTFNAPASYTDLLIPRTDLSPLFPALAEKFILHHGGEIKTRSKLNSLQTNNGLVESIYVNNEKLSFDQFILATPPSVTASLLKDINETSAIYKQITQLKFEPISTLYLQFKQPVSLPATMTGMLNGLTEWVFERRVDGYADVLAAVFSARGEHSQLTAEQLTKQVLRELSCCIDHLPELLDSKLIIDKRAAFQCHPGVDQNRPGIRTPIKNLNLCGDYVYIEENNQPGLPSTLEGALRSGVKCAQIIISN
ncbi:Phytoene desaturase, pro-zeta-carotene producing [hydrothermal vent metagenome]|uniref:Phytoene desaturase, pro-zeta-carotene producing n=1 Tax=hydrothermal vent metagenome TaxID=652676 RepID=A0A3B0XF25_9ZZZZ